MAWPMGVDLEAAARARARQEAMADVRLIDHKGDSNAKNDARRMRRQSTLDGWSADDGDMISDVGGWKARTASVKLTRLSIEDET